MKPISLIPPVVALALVGGWIGTQRQSIFTLEKESELLRNHIATARAAAASEASQHEAETPNGKPAKEKEAMDWKKIAAQMLEMRNGEGMGDMRSLIRLQQRMQALTKEELVSALNEIATLDLTAESRQMLEQMLIGPLIEKDPQLALARFSDRLQEQNGAIGWQLSRALSKWAEKDPAKATAWFDEQIEAGKFDSKSLDGKSQSRLQFESALIRTLLSTDAEGAARRLGGIPEEQRADALRQYSVNQIKEEDQKAFAKLVRDQVPEKDRSGVIAQAASSLVSKGYPEVTAYLDHIEATPAERTATVEQAASSKIQQLAYQKHVAREDFDTMREWVNAQSPGTADATTGKVLASALGMGGDSRFKFEDAAALAVQYQEASGNDDVMVNFLDGWRTEDKEESIKLAAKIADPTRREQVLKNLK
ncbi:MAG: hypothetical protein ABI162_03585 [Luteolibacter sp.]